MMNRLEPSTSKIEADPTALGTAVLAPELLAECERNQWIRPFTAGEVLFREGEEPAGVFVILDGQVAISVSKGERRRLTLRRAGAGEMLGLMSTCGGRPYIVTATSVRAGRLAFVPQVSFMDLMNRTPELRAQVLALLSTEMERAHGHVREIAARV